MTTVNQRRIRLAIIGGGSGSMIGPVHQTAIRFDDLYDLVAGVVSSDAERALIRGQGMGIARPYRTVAELLEGERGRIDEWAEQGRLVTRITDTKRRDRLLQARNQRITNRVVHK